MERKRSKLCHTEEFLPFCHGEWEMAEGFEHEVMCPSSVWKGLWGRGAEGGPKGWIQSEDLPGS